MQISKITLGTAQLGLPYGIANKSGKPNIKSSYSILELALKSGINAFDTSPVYGNSEKIIGRFLKLFKSQTPIMVTKIPKIQCRINSSFRTVYEQVKKSIILSANKLNLKQIPICLLHDASDINDYDGLVTKSLVKIKEEGFVKFIGASVYHPREVREFLRVEDFDVIQIPVNVFDTRLIRGGLLEELTHRGVLIFARSIFLQGLFFLDEKNIPPYLHLAKEPIMELHKISSKYEITIPQLAFTFVRDLPGITSLVIGVETRNQLKDNIKLLSSPSLPNDIRQTILDTFCKIPEKLVNPVLWRKGFDKYEC